MANEEAVKMPEDPSAAVAAAAGQAGAPADTPPGMPGEPAAPANAGGAGKPGSSDKEKKNLDLILDIPLRVTVELGRAKMVVSDLLNLSQGSVIELNKLAGEPLEVLVNDKLVARGEAVVVNEKFGVRLTDIISPTERVAQLR